MTITTTDVTTIEPLTHQEAMRLQARELDRALALLQTLGDPAWTAQTDCPAWDVRAMYQHVLGACEAGASILENIRQLARARAYRKQHGGPLEAALSAVQVRERADLTQDHADSSAVTLALASPTAASRPLTGARRR